MSTSSWIHRWITRLTDECVRYMTRKGSDCVPNFISSGLWATNAEIFSNLRFLRKFQLFSPNCATKHIFPKTQIYLIDFSQMCVPPTIFQPHLRNKSRDFPENVETDK